ncbi:MAG: FtsW/RodA/SpoVE family cell cycle protein [Coprococcus sp.]
MIQRRKIFQYHTNKYNVHMYDFRLVIYVWVLGIIGVLVINSAADGFAAKQLIGFIGGSVVMIIFSLIDYNYIAKFEWFLYSINIGMLVAVKLFGINVNGATRWFSLGPFGTLQPSELSKVIMLVIFSHLISEQREKINNISVILRIGVLYAVPMFLIVMEPDLSTTLVFAFLFCTLMFVGGISYKIIGIILGTCIPLAGVLIWYVQQPNQILLRDYQVDRIMSFLNPSDYLLTTYNQQYNSTMAIGSGMLTGKGLNNNTITSVKGGNFISEPQTDFIFAVVGEELGFIGSCVVLGLILLIVLECLHIAKDARDMRGRLIAAGVAGIITFQSFVNVGVATGILPNTGLPLPFVSYGLSSLLSNFLCIGLVLNVGLQRNRR